MPDVNKMINDINLAKDRLLEKSQKFKIELKTNVFININGEKINILKGSDKERILECSMDSRLLRRILDRKSHWNNAEIGTHIDFLRNPNKMEPDVHTIMSFFHL
jgi:UDP-MurNAc hydroxylase